MADRPILFSAPMVRALLEGRKTQTRRVLKPQPEWTGTMWWLSGPRGGFFCDHHDNDIAEAALVFQRHAVGDRLWVREAFMPLPVEPPPSDQRQTRWEIVYGAGGQAEKIAPQGYDPMLYNYERWSPSIHMPRWASRITLIVEAVKVERLQSISEADAVAEGMIESNCPGDESHGAWTGGVDFLFGWNARGAFRRTWELINGPGSWGANPWVTAISFRVVMANIDNLPPAE